MTYIGNIVSTLYIIQDCFPRGSPLPSHSRAKRFSSNFISPKLALEDNESTETQQERNSEAKTSNTEQFENGHQTDHISGHPSSCGSSSVSPLASSEWEGLARDSTSHIHIPNNGTKFI